jgi:hypothetical protein
LADYLEGDLALEDRAILDAHLDQCHSCSLEVEEMLQTIRLLHTLPEPEIPPMIAANVMRRIRAGESRLGFFARMQKAVGSILEPTFVLPASAIAVAALVVTVTQGPQMNFFGEDEREAARISSNGRQPAVAALPLLASPSVSTVRLPSGRDSLAGGDFFGGGDALRRGDAPPNPNASQSVTRRIRIRVDGSGVARLSMSRSSPVTVSAPAPAVTVVSALAFSSEVPEAWAAQFSRVMYGTPASLAADRMGRTALKASASRLGGVSGGLRSVALTQTASRSRIFANLDRGDADPRDAWLALGFEDPVEFARYIAGRNLAEQELWASRLSDRAASRGLMDDLLRALRDSGDSTASWIADDFAAQAANRSSLDSSGEPAPPILR